MSAWLILIEMRDTAGATILVNFKLQPDIFVDKFFCQLPQNERNFAYKNRVRVNNFLKVVNSPGTF